MASTKQLGIPGVPFPVGVEHYRGPTPKIDVWDEDYERLAKSGFRIVRSHSYWNHMEPRPGIYELDDFDYMFDLAEKHGLYVWLDVMLATHGAGPEWLTREHPEIRVVNYLGQVVAPHAHPAYPQGGVIHCYNNPAWREYGGALIRHVVNRYKDRPSLLVWGLWDGFNHSGAWNPQGGGYPCYCPSCLTRYKAWLHGRFNSLEELNTRMQRRYRRWEDVDAPHSNDNVVEMLLYRRFHYEAMADHLQWMVAEAEAIDPVHELRSHGAWFPRPFDEHGAPHVDSWGMSMPSNNLLTSENPYKLSERALIFDLSRSLGRDGRWWIEEIYAGMSPAGVTWKKQSDPRETNMLLWMSLIGGSAGAMYWQYRPEYLSFESPGFNLVALDGKPTERFHATVQAIEQIDQLSDHLPLEFPQPDVAVVFHPESQDLFGLNGENDRFLSDLRGTHQTLWTHGIQADVVTPNMDWAGYRLVFLPNVTLMTEELQNRLKRTLQDSPETHFVAEGSFGMYSPDGQSSYGPPEGLAGQLGVRIADFSAVTTLDIKQGRNILQTPHGNISITTPCGYAMLEPTGSSRAIAKLDGHTVGIQTADKRFTWYGLTLSAGFGDIGQPKLVLGSARDAGAEAPVVVEGDRIVPVARCSKKGGWLVFALNLERSLARATLRPRWQTTHAQELLTGADLEVKNGGFEVEVQPWSLAVVHCQEA